MRCHATVTYLFSAEMTPRTKIGHYLTYCLVAAKNGRSVSITIKDYIWYSFNFLGSFEWSSQFVYFKETYNPYGVMWFWPVIKRGSDTSDENCVFALFCRLVRKPFNIEITLMTAIGDVRKTGFQTTPKLTPKLNPFTLFGVRKPDKW